MLRTVGRTGSRHSADELFTATGERRQIYARDTRFDDAAPLVRMALGEANLLRPDAKAGHLVCPIPGCEDVRYTTRAGSRRDHFVHRHRGGAAHSPETWFHYTGKRLVGAWAQDRYPDARIVIDHEAVSNGQIPDVLIEFPDGRRFAFEVQYAALTQDEWTWRHAGYMVQGIVDVWLFGHLPRYLRRDRYFEDEYVIGPLIRTVIAAGARPFWINPDEALVGSRRRLSDESWRGAFEYDAGPDASRTMTLALDALADCRVEGTDFLTPLDDAERALAAAAEARRQRELDERLAWEAAERARAERKASTATWRVQKDAERAEEYARSIRPWVHRDLRGALDVIEITMPADVGIRLHPAHWHALVFRDLIEGRVGQTFTYTDVCRPFMNMGEPKWIYRAVTAYLFHLSRAGYVEFWAQGYWIETEITVLADSKNPPAQPGWERGYG